MYEFVDWAVYLSEIGVCALAIGFFGALGMAVAFWMIAKTFQIFDEDIGGVIGH